MFVAAAADQPLVVLVVSDDVLQEARRNLAYHSAESVPALERLLDAIPFERVTLTRRLVRAAAKVVAVKDAHVLAAARKARVDALVTFDRKHLLGNPAVSRYIRAPVIEPKEAMALLAPAGANC